MLNITPNTDSSERNNDASEDSIYLRQIFCNRNATRELKIPRYNIEKITLELLSNATEKDPSISGETDQEKTAATINCIQVRITGFLS